MDFSLPTVIFAMAFLTKRCFFRQPVFAYKRADSSVQNSAKKWDVPKKCLLAVQDSSRSDIVCPLGPTNNQSLGSIKE